MKIQIPEGIDFLSDADKVIKFLFRINGLG